MRLRYHIVQTALMTALVFMAVPAAAEDVLLTLTGAVAAWQGGDDARGFRYDGLA